MQLLIQNLSVRAHTLFLVKEIDFTLALKESLSVIGPSGSGKTSLVKAILGLSQNLFVTGKIFTNGRMIQDGNHRIVPLAKRRFGYIPQDLALWPHLTVIQTLTLACLFAGIEKKMSVGWLQELLTACSLTSLAHKKPSDLSGGEKQRLALARALVGQPELLVLDEPFSGLDIVAKAELIELIVQQKATLGLTIIFISHDLSESLAMGQNILIMDKGRQIWFGNKDLLTEERFLAHWNPLRSNLLRDGLKAHEPKKTCSHIGCAVG